PNNNKKMTTIRQYLYSGNVDKVIKIPGEKVYEEFNDRLGVSKREVIGKGNPDLLTEKKAIDAILLMSGATNGKRAVEGWKSMEEKTGLKLTEIAEAREEEDFTLAALTAQPRTSISTPMWSGMEKDGRRYSPFTVNTEYNLPWRTLTGRQSFYLDHEMILDFGEALPLYLPPLNKGPFVKNDRQVADGGKSLTLRYLTPH